MLPFEISADGINVREAIELCQKAYTTVPIFRNTIDMMSEFANSEIYLEGGNANSREFFGKLFDKIKLNNLKDQYFREYYRSGNIFLYRIDGKFNLSDFKKFAQNVADRPASNKFPLKYIVLNPNVVQYSTQKMEHMQKSFLSLIWKGLQILKTITINKF
jgi:hypothetical protein